MKELRLGIFVLLALIAIYISGCTTNDTLEKYEPLKISEFEEIEDYKVDLTKLDELSEDVLTNMVESQLYVKVNEIDGTLELTFDEDESNAVLLYSEDWAKIADLAEVTESYRSVVLAQEELINTKNETIRSLQQLVLLQQEGKQIYRDNFLMANTLYIQEHKIRMREKLSNDIRFFTSAIGIIAVAML